MGRWNNTYKPGTIGAGTTIQNQHPGNKIAKAVTEIQERVFNEVEITSNSELINVTVDSNDNKLHFNIKLNVEFIETNICENGTTRTVKLVVVQ